MNKNTTTLKDVALEAGFSVMTVSNVLNGKKLNHASPRSRALIEEAARRLNYRPNLNARQLVTRQSNRIGLLIDVNSPMFYRDVMLELEPLAFADELRLQVGFVHGTFDSLEQYIEDFRGSGIDSVVCLAHAYPKFGEQVPGLLEEFEHVVFMEQPLAPTSHPVVAADHYHNFRNAVTEMLRRGYRRIFSFRSDYRDCAYTESLRGIRDAYQESGVAFREEFWWPCATEWWHNYESTAAELKRIMPEKPDALIVGNDESMFWTLRALRDMQLNVPGDIALFSAELWRYGWSAIPSFSGFDYNAPELARKIMGQLRNARKTSSGSGSRELIPSKIVWGESCPEKTTKS